MRDAWEGFNQTPFPSPYEKSTQEGQIFVPFVLFEWDPERPARSRKGKPRVGVVTQSYLERSGSDLSDLEASILHQATTQPVSFYEVLRSAPGVSLVLRDILIGGDTEVMERTASQSLRPGDIAYAQIWRLPEVSTLGRLAPMAVPPGKKVEIVGLRRKLRKKIAKQARELEAEDLVRYAEEIRTVYLDIRDGLLMPPRFCNTDGDSLLFHTLTFRVGSAQAAFDALAPLAWGQTKEELLGGAEWAADGTLRGGEIEWRKKGNLKFKTWDNTILGHLSIAGRTLVVEVNSKERAERIRQEIEQRMGILAVHRSTVTETPEESVAKGKLKMAAGGGASKVGDPLRDPEVRRQVDMQLQRQMENWVHEKIPALGGLTPLQAVRDADGREVVEALLLDWERREERVAGANMIRPDIGAIRRLLDLGPSVS